MRRALLALAVTAFTVLALAGPTSAASGQVTASAASSQVMRFSFHGAFADALWQTSSATSFTDTFVNVSKSLQGSELFVDQFTANFDANGNFTGATDTSADVTSGFSFAIDKALLRSASVSGSGLSAMTCTFDANFDLIGCSATTIDVTATWTGQGPISRGVFNDHFKSDGFSATDHFNGTDRAATATGTFNGNTLSASDLQFANLGTANAGTTIVCIGTSC
jgi:hypothetical protein